ncbi:MAG: sulfatase-like hydrolase/transferase [Kiritimatiellae bacterium]|nr:sulfatase-like hydrolase/transferase [Kiritimatiellia bacterium]
MKRRDFLKAMGAAAVTMPGVLPAMASDSVREVNTAGALCAHSGKKPNVILVLCDDLGWGDLGQFWQNQRAAEGKIHIDTPHLDAAIQRGVMMTNAYTTAPVCAPARASMVTGKHQGHCNLRDNRFDCPIATDLTIGSVMKAAGYTTWHIGKWGIGGGYESQGKQPRRAMACDAGFDYSYGYPGHGHGHSFYRWGGDGKYDWRTNKNGSPCIENISAAVYGDATLRAHYSALSSGAAGMDFEADTDPGATYYRRLISDDEARFCYDTDLFTAKIKQLIKSHQDAKRDEPFFCYACYTTVHGAGSWQTQGDPKLAKRDNFHVPGKAYPESNAADTVWGGGVTWEKDAQGYLPFKEGVEGNNTSNTYIHPDYRGYKTASQRRYATNVRRLDEALGDLFNFLKVRGLENDTLFIFTSDNGPAGEYLSPAGLSWVEGAFDSNGPHKGMKRWCYEGGLREPTFAVWPGVIPAHAEGAPRQLNNPFQFPAWMATLADVAGLPQPAHCDGVSLLPALTNSGAQLPMRVYAEYQDGGSGYGYGFEQMVRDGDYVLIRNHGATGEVELYNVVVDPSQETNLAKEPNYADRVRRMRDLLVNCRIPIAKVPEACGAYGAYAVWNGGDAYVTPTHPAAPTPHGVDELPMPSVPATGALPKHEVRLFLAGAESWPWVPNFRTLLPEASYLAADVDEVRAVLPFNQPFGIAIRGWLEVPTEQTLTFTAKGAGGCQLWLHEAHILEYEMGDCTDGKQTTYKLAAGRHPFRLYLTSKKGKQGLCSVTAGTQHLV